MVVTREARRAARRFAESPLAATSVPGSDLAAKGLQDLAAGAVTDEALLVSIAAPRLRLLGIAVPRVMPNPEEHLYDSLRARVGDGAHREFNALRRRIVSFQRAVPLVLANRAHA